jgi:hypothetical protein
MNNLQLTCGNCAYYLATENHQLFGYCNLWGGELVKISDVACGSIQLLEEYAGDEVEV